MSLIHLLQSRFNIEKQRGDSKTFQTALKNFISIDLKFRNILIGMIQGLMTYEELKFYHTHKSELRKRIMSMQLKRYIETFSIESYE